MRRITIIIDDHGFDVEEDGKICDGLGWDEMLGQVAMLTIPPSRVGKGFAMHTPAEWVVLRERTFPSKPEQVDPSPQIEGPDSWPARIA